MGWYLTKYNQKYIRELNIKPFLEAYIQSIVLKKTLESISLYQKRGYDQESRGEEEVARAANVIDKNSLE